LLALSLNLSQHQSLSAMHVSTASQCCVSQHRVLSSIATPRTSCFTCRHTVRPARRSFRRVFAGEIAQGQTVRVTQAVTVYHAAKHKAGLNLEGMEGTVLGVIDKHNGKELSANLPVKVQFKLPAEDGGKEGKLIAHLTEAEVEAV